MRALLAAAVLLAPVSAQSGRTLALLSPPLVGATMRYELQHPFSAAGNPYFVIWSEGHHAGALTPSLGGIQVVGALLTDPTQFAIVHSGALSGAAPQQHDFAIPNTQALSGYQWELQSFDLAANPPTLAFSDNELQLEVQAVPDAMVWIPAGSFQMGASGGAPTEQPVHTVQITQPFWMGRHEVTQASFLAVTGSNPSYFQAPAVPGSDQRPVEQVSWNDAVLYCQQLQAHEQALGRVPAGYTYRLPTEAEWEYCCRAGTGTPFAFGASLDCATANHHAVSGRCVPLPAPPWGQTAVVGSYPANAFGLHDLHGNVFEWCLDSWNGTANYPSGPVQDPFRQVGAGRIVRGGGWLNPENICRSSFRFQELPGYVGSNTGFRVVLAPIVP